MESDNNPTTSGQTTEKAPARKKIRRKRSNRRKNTKSISSNPRFTLVIKILLKQMQKHFCNFNIHLQKCVKELLKVAFHKEMLSLLKGKEYMRYKEIVSLYRMEYPIECDRQLINKLVVNMAAGKYQDFFDSVDMDTANTIIDNSSSNMQVSEVHTAPNMGAEIKKETKQGKKKRPRRKRAKGPRFISPNPKFTLVIRLLLKQFRKHYCNFDIQLRQQLEELLRILFHKELVILLKGKQYMGYKEILPLYRAKYPVESDELLIEKLVIDIALGKYQDYFKSLNSNKANMERNSISSSIENLLAHIAPERDLVFTEPKQEPQHAEGHSFIIPESNITLVMNILLKEIRKYFCNFDIHLKQYIEELLKVMYREELLILLNGKGYMRYNEILALYRLQHPKEHDKLLIDKLLLDIAAGKYKEFFESLKAEKMNM